MFISNRIIRGALTLTWRENAMITFSRTPLCHAEEISGLIDFDQLLFIYRNNLFFGIPTGDCNL
jgi:hypothetical protein